MDPDQVQTALIAFGSLPLMCAAALATNGRPIDLSDLLVASGASFIMFSATVSLLRKYV